MILRWLKQTADEDYHITPSGVKPQKQLTHSIDNDLHLWNTGPTLE